MSITPLGVPNGLKRTKKLPGLHPQCRPSDRQPPPGRWPSERLACALKNRNDAHTQIHIMCGNGCVIDGGIVAGPCKKSDFRDAGEFFVASAGEDAKPILQAAAPRTASSTSHAVRFFSSSPASPAL